MKVATRSSRMPLQEGIELLRRRVSSTSHHQSTTLQPQPRGNVFFNLPTSIWLLPSSQLSQRWARDSRRERIEPERHCACLSDPHTFILRTCHPPLTLCRHVFVIRSSCASSECGSSGHLQGTRCICPCDSDSDGVSVCPSTRAHSHALRLTLAACVSLGC
jgi:hypothetical protein